MKYNSVCILKYYQVPSISIILPSRTAWSAIFFLRPSVCPQLLLPNGLRISALERGRDTGERVCLFVACRAGIAMLDAVKVAPPRPFHTCLYRAVALIDALTLRFKCVSVLRGFTLIEVLAIPCASAQMRSKYNNSQDQRK